MSESRPVPTEGPPELSHKFQCILRWMPAEKARKDERVVLVELMDGSLAWMCGDCGANAPVEKKQS
jgi:hypothetical protein